tara:strand:- start:1079 stop:1351 length:273 start_codon:yes stop_codon:yes gene_type:complete
MSQFYEHLDGEGIELALAIERHVVEVLDGAKVSQFESQDAFIAWVETGDYYESLDNDDLGEDGAGELMALIYQKLIADEEATRPRSGPRL